MFGKHRRPGDAAIIGALRTEVNRLVLALARAGVIDPQTGEEVPAIEMLKRAQHWRSVAMELGHLNDALNRERDAALAERDDLASKLKTVSPVPVTVFPYPAALVTEPDACQECGTVPVVYVNANGFRLCSACSEGCSSECREGHTYEGGCALASDTHTPRLYERVSQVVREVQKPSQEDGERYYCPTSGDVESPTHGGFQTCCNRADLHRPVERDILSHEHEWSPLGFCRHCPARKDDPVTVPIPLVKPLWEKHSGICVCEHLWDQHRPADNPLRSSEVICAACQAAGLTTLACRTFSSKEKQP